MMRPAVSDAEPSQTPSRLTPRAVSDPEPPAERGCVSAGDRNRLTAGETELGGSAEQRSKLHRSRQVGDVLPVNADEPERLPAALDLGQRRPPQVAAIVGHDADE